MVRAKPLLCCSEGPERSMPLLAAVRERAGRPLQAPFHIPGHKQGRGGGIPPQFRDAMGPALCHDLTELPGTAWSCVRS